MSNLSKLIAGAVATIPMTMVMMKGHKHLPNKEKYPLAPRVISMNIAQELGLRKNLSEKERVAITLINHFVYGGMSSVLFFPLAKKLKINNQVAGISYGLFVWGINYLGILPKLKLYRRPKREPLERQALMIFAHVIWGSALGIMQSLNGQKTKA